MLALSIRQPFAELILRGIKRVEYRSRATRILGERFWIYASKGSGFGGGGSGKNGAKIWSRDLVVPGAGAGAGEDVPAWMIELAEQVGMIEPGVLLPRGVIVGSAVISHCTRGGDQGQFEWHLQNVERLPHPRKPAKMPQPVWFKPF